MHKIKFLLSLLGIAAVGACTALTSGCSSTNKQQIVNSSSGSGIRVKAAVPVGSAESVGLEIFVGKFNITTALQPTSSNVIHSANLVVAVSGRGKQTASGNIAGATSAAAAAASTATGTNGLAANPPNTVAASPTAAIANGSSDTSFVALGDGYASQRMGTNEVTEANTDTAP